MEKSFLRLKDKAVRVAYVEAELTNGLAHQIRAIRQQRNWTQGHLAKRLKTTQGVVSRLEDPSYGRFSVKTLLQVANVFDVALYARFLPFSEFMFQTWDTSPQRLQVLPYAKDTERVCFYAETHRNAYIEKIEPEITEVGNKSIINLSDEPKDLTAPSFTATGFIDITAPRNFLRFGNPQLDLDNGVKVIQESEQL